MSRKIPSTSRVQGASLTSVSRTLALVFVLACGGAAARPAEVPAQVAESRSEADAPALASDPPSGSSPREPLRESALRVVVRIPLESIADRANEAAPRVLAEDRWGVSWLPVGAGYRVTRGRIALRGSGDGVEWAVPVALAGRADPVGACDAALTARLSTRVELTRDFRLRALSRPGPLEWRRRCRVLGAVDLTPLIEPAVLAAQTSVARQIDARVSEQRLDVEALWARLSERVELAEGFGLWLRPSRIGVSALRATDEAIEVLVEIGVRPIAAMEAPVDAAPIPLPEATRIEGGERSFDLRAELEIPLARVAQEVDTIARAQLAEMGAELGSVRAIGGTDAIWIGLTIARPIPITAWFGASLGVDPSTHRIALTNVRASDETRASLEAFGIDPAFVEESLRLQASVPVERIEEARAEVQRALAAPIGVPGGELRIEAPEVVLVGTFHTPSTVGLVVDLRGSAELVTELPRE